LEAIMTEFGAELRPRALDYLDLDSLFTTDRLDQRDKVREFVDTRIRPNINEWYEQARFRSNWLRSSVSSACSACICTAMAAQGGAPSSTGSRPWSWKQATPASARSSRCRVPRDVRDPQARLRGAEEALAPADGVRRDHRCFALTEPTAGSDPASMRTRAIRDGSDWVITGTKRWIGLASIAQVAIIWAATDEGIRGFIVPTDSAGFTAVPIEPKLSMRASIQCDVSLDEVRLPADAVLPEANGLKGPLACLNEARYGIVWGALGAARDSYEDSSEVRP
jgi:glutaryl-CoA dehydrogenase